LRKSCEGTKKYSQRSQAKPTTENYFFHVELPENDTISGTIRQKIPPERLASFDRCWKSALGMRQNSSKTERDCVEDPPQQGCQREGLHIGHDFLHCGRCCGWLSAQPRSNQSDSAGSIQLGRRYTRFMDTHPAFYRPFSTFEDFVSHPSAPLFSFQFGG